MSLINLSKDHKALTLTSFIVFVFLSITIAIIPAFNMQESVEPLSQEEEFTESEKRGLEVYVSEGCIGCHTQQVRGIEMDELWGNRPSMPSDYYYSKKRPSIWKAAPSLLGSERTGPDLTSVGDRQPSVDWHFIHLYNPRIVVKESVMPAYPWLFKEIYRPDSTEQIIKVPSKYLKNPGYDLVPTEKANDLVAYLTRLKQTNPRFKVDFIPSSKKDEFVENSTDQPKVDGKALYIKFCASCHQPNGEGLSGAFPPLKGSQVVLDKDYDLMVKIILQGYDARKEYGVMPALGGLLNDKELAAIVNHEKNSWGNTADEIEASDVKRIRDFVNAISDEEE